STGASGRSTRTSPRRPGDAGSTPTDAHPARVAAPTSAVASRRLERTRRHAGRPRLPLAGGAALLQVAGQGLAGLAGGLRVRVERARGRERRLVGGRDARDRGELAGARLLVRALHVAALAGLDAGGHVGLDEVALAHDLAHGVAVGAVGRDEGGEDDD